MVECRDSKGRFWSDNPKSYICKQEDGKVVEEHRLLWEKNYGKIPDGSYVHHINGDKRDNRLSNITQKISRFGIRKQTTLTQLNSMIGEKIMKHLEKRVSLKNVAVLLGFYGFYQILKHIY
jgi:hypothetical protein